jgi:hypothetical protein
MNRILALVGLGILSPLVFFLGAAPFEVPGQNPIMDESRRISRRRDLLRGVPVLARAKKRQTGDLKLGAALRHGSAHRRNLSSR